MPAKTSGALVLAALSLALALLGACYDMPLIPESSLTVAGSAGRDSASASAGAGAGGAPSASSGAPHTDGGSKPNGAGASAGGASNSGGIAGTTGQAGSGGAPYITWLELSGSSAPSSFPTNADLGIEGSFYAYGDDCSKLVWDELGRCASGTLCAPEPSLDNWGISIGFDFRNTGTEGMPPNTKLTWNPDDVAARGVAWQVRGNAPQLEVWVLNMAPSWQGECSDMKCEIVGPPDGVAPAALKDELDFDNMIKDDWGNSGIQYEFAPENVHALQFKIAAVKVGAAKFNFCIDALGIVR